MTNEMWFTAFLLHSIGRRLPFTMFRCAGPVSVAIFASSITLDPIMKKSVAALKNNTAAAAGQLILFFYQAYTALFCKQDDFAPPPSPIAEREIILIRRTGRGYHTIASITMSLS
jgi:hypothetical protein